MFEGCYDVRIVNKEDKFCILSLLYLYLEVVLVWMLLFKILFSFKDERSWFSSNVLLNVVYYKFNRFKIWLYDKLEGCLLVVK